MDQTSAKRSQYVTAASVLTVLLFALFLVGHLVGGLQSLVLMLTPWFYLLAGALVLYPSIRTSGKPFVVWAALTLIVVFVLSALGAANDKVFGAFSYGPTLGFGFFDTPLVPAFNWVLVLYAGTRFAQSRLQGTSGVVGESIVAVCTGVLIMFYEWMIIPLAERMDYWNFDNGGAGFRHYFAWFVIGTVASFTYLYYIKPRLQKVHLAESQTAAEFTASRLVSLYAFCQLVFLVTLRIVWAANGN